MPPNNAPNLNVAGLTPQQQAYIQQLVGAAIQNNPGAQAAVQAVVQQQVQQQVTQNNQASLQAGTATTGVNNGKDLLDILNGELRRGGNVSRLAHGFQAFIDEGNLAGLGRATDAIQRPIYKAITGSDEVPIHPFFLVVATRLIDEAIKSYDRHVTQPRWRDVAAGVQGQIDSALSRLSTNEALQKDANYRKALARAAAEEDRAEERVRGAGFWLRNGVNL